MKRLWMLLIFGWLTAVACQAVGADRGTAVTPTISPAPTSSAPPSPTLTPTATAVSTPTPPPAGAGRPYLSRYRLVAFYGSITGPGLGILGEHPREEMTALLQARAAQYQTLSPDRTVLPAYHIVIAVANPQPPAYHHLIDVALVERWVRDAAREGTAVILDIQPGRGDVLTILQMYRHLLYRPHVHLALDAEFALGPGEVPGQAVGRLTAQTINQVQASLNDIGAEIGWQKVLILHQFADRMLPDKEKFALFPFVEVVINGDGVGSPPQKIHNYEQYAAEPGFMYGGIKLFPEDGDAPLLTPEEVMGLRPLPAVIIYQ